MEAKQTVLDYIIGDYSQLKEALIKSNNFKLVKTAAIVPDNRSNRTTHEIQTWLLISTTIATVFPALKFY